MFLLENTAANNAQKKNPPFWLEEPKKFFKQGDEKCR
jgi:hypothetical protein